NCSTRPAAFLQRYRTAGIRQSLFNIQSRASRRNTPSRHGGTPPATTGIRDTLCPAADRQSQIEPPGAFYRLSPFLFENAHPHVAVPLAADECAFAFYTLLHKATPLVAGYSPLVEGEHGQVHPV